MRTLLCNLHIVGFMLLANTSGAIAANSESNPVVVKQLKEGKLMHQGNSASAKWLEMSITELQAEMQAGNLSSERLVQFYLHRIDEFNGANKLDINALQMVNGQALAAAVELDKERLAKGPRSALHGIPVLVKDNYETKEMPTTAGSKLFARHQPDRDAHLVERLRAAGAVILGKTTMHEFAYGITTVGSNFGKTRNPYDLTRNPGGSSGGSGAAVAANFATVAMGSDTCGSIRIPAAHNNLVGLRGTQGLSSRRGIVPLSSSQDIGGPLAKSVEDLAIVLDATVGFDPGDVQTEIVRNKPVANYQTQLQALEGLRIGVLEDWMVKDPADQEVANVISTALSFMRTAADWQVQGLKSPKVNTSLEREFAGHLVLMRDFATDIECYLADNPSLGFAGLQELIDADEVHKDVMPSLLASASVADIAESRYEQELDQREVVRGALLNLMKEHNLDALAYPTIRRVAAKIGDEQLGTNCRLSANSGLPAISVPAGFTAGGMPVGLELLAEPFSELKLLQMAYSLEQKYPQRRAPKALHSPPSGQQVTP